MESITYGVIKETHILLNRRRTTYGVAAFICEGGITTIITSARDLSPKQEKITELAELCNKLHLSPIHLSDVAEDFLAQ